MIHERIKQLIDVQGMTVARFSDKVGVENHQTMYKLLKNGTNPSADTIIGILTAFRNLNPRWLLLGDGEMFDSGTEEMKKELESLRNAVADKDRIIRLMEMQSAPQGK
jgi:transcriptional regulator with XRE-family HTH domain